MKKNKTLLLILLILVGLLFFVGCKSRLNEGKIKEIISLKYSDYMDKDKKIVFCDKTDYFNLTDAYFEKEFINKEYKIDPILKKNCNLLKEELDEGSVILVLKNMMGHAYHIFDDTHDLNFLVLQDTDSRDEDRGFVETITPKGFLGEIETHAVNYFSVYCEEQKDCSKEFMEKLKYNAFSRKTDGSMSWDTFHKIEEENLNILDQMNLNFETFDVYAVVISTGEGGPGCHITKLILYLDQEGNIIKETANKQCAAVESA